MDLVQETTELDATPDEVWAALTDPEGAAAWLGPETVLDPTAGGTIAGPDPESGVARTGTIRHAEPGRRLEYTWWPSDPSSDIPASTVSIDLIPSDRGTRLVVTERRLDATASISATSLTTGSAAWRWRLAAIEVGIWCRQSAGVWR